MVATAIGLVVLTSGFASHPPATWALVSLALVGCLLEVSGTRNARGGVTGSLVFVFHLAIGLILGAFYGALTAGFSSIVSQLYQRMTPIKAIFNVAERVVSVALTFSVYHVMGGQNPPAFLVPGTGGPDGDLNRALIEVGLFLVSALVYFVANSLAVNSAVSLATGRPFWNTWRSNTVWVLGYDLAASLLALLVVAGFVRSQSGAVVEQFGFIVVVLGLILVKHIYGKLNTVQDLYQELDRAYEELELNVREQLAMMVKAIEARDPYTSGHSRRVCGLSRAIAIELGLEVTEIEDIENAALLHDVGKIHAEFAPLLQKEGKLTEDEWKLMKTHSEMSAELVGSFSRFQGYVVSCVRHHHERWDGQGYPDEIAGDAIPLGARIITIADTVDAMTTNRPYRDALPLETVLSELNKGRDTQFEGRLIELAVNSVAVRRLIADPTLIREYLPQPQIRARANKALRNVVTRTRL